MLEICGESQFLICCDSGVATEFRFDSRPRTGSRIVLKSTWLTSPNVRRERLVGVSGRLAGGGHVYMSGGGGGGLRYGFFLLAVFPPYITGDMPAQQVIAGPRGLVGPWPRVSGYRVGIRQLGRGREAAIVATLHDPIAGCALRLSLWWVGRNGCSIVVGRGRFPCDNLSPMWGWARHAPRVNRREGDDAG